MSKEIIIFIILQLVNVTLSVIKSIVQIKGTKWLAAMVNACYYALYTVVVIYMVADIALIIKIAITFIANLTGTLIAMTIVDKLRKDKLWKIEATIRSADAEKIDEALKSIPHSYIRITDKHTIFSFFCATKADSSKVKEILKPYNAKYFITENVNSIF